MVVWSGAARRDAERRDAKRSGAELGAVNLFWQQFRQNYDADKGTVQYRSVKHGSHQPKCPPLHLRKVKFSLSDSLEVAT